MVPSFFHRRNVMLIIGVLLVACVLAAVLGMWQDWSFYRRLMDKYEIMDSSKHPEEIDLTGYDFEEDYEEAPGPINYQSIFETEAFMLFASMVLGFIAGFVITVIIWVFV